MANIYVKSGNATTWAASTTYAAGAKVVSASATNYWVYYTAAGGTSGGTEPVWNNVDGGTSPTDGTITDWVSYPASSWTYATISVTRATTSSAAGDYIYVSNNHNETSAVTTSITFPGTVSNPTYLLCADDTSGTPPTTLATTAQISTTGGTAIFMYGSVYCYGIIFTGSSGASSGSIQFALGTGVAQIEIFEQCKFRLGSTAASTLVFFAIGTSATVTNRVVEWRNCTAKFSASSNQHLYAAAAAFYWNGGGFESGSSSPSTGLFRTGSSSAAGQIYLSGVDFSNLSSGIYLTSPINTSPGVLMARNCRMPSGWANTVVNTTVNGPYSPIAMYNSSGSAVNYNTIYQTYYGKVIPETTYVRSGGASDGITPISWNVASTSNAGYPVGICYTPEIVTWVNNTGVSKTVTVEILHDSVTNLTDAEVWLEVMYLGTSAAPLGTWINDSKSNVLAAATDQATSTATWTTTGMANPNKQKVSVTLTTQLKGYVHARVALAKPSKTIYVDPVVTVA